MRNGTVTTTADALRPDEGEIRIDPSVVMPPVSPGGTLPLTTALLRVAATTVSFATPGHRGGRSCGQI